MPYQRKKIFGGKRVFAIFCGDGEKEQFLGIQLAVSPESARNIFRLHLNCSNGSSFSPVELSARLATKKQVASVCPMCRRNNPKNPGKLCRLCKPIQRTIRLAKIRSTAIAFAKATADKKASAQTTPAP